MVYRTTSMATSTMNCSACNWVGAHTPLFVRDITHAETNSTAASENVSTYEAGHSPTTYMWAGLDYNGTAENNSGTLTTWTRRSYCRVLTSLEPTLRSSTFHTLQRCLHEPLPSGTYVTREALRGLLWYRGILRGPWMGERLVPRGL